MQILQVSFNYIKIVLLNKQYIKSELLINNFKKITQRSKNSSWSSMTIINVNFTNDQQLSVVVAKCWFSWFVVWDRTFMCTVFIVTLT